MPMKSPGNNSYFRSLIHFKMTQRKNFVMQYSVPHKWPVWPFVSVQKIRLVDCLKRHTLMKRTNNSGRWFIRLHRNSTRCQLNPTVLTTLKNPVNHRSRDLRLTHQAVQDSHSGHTAVLVEITHTVIIATKTSIQPHCASYSVLP